jgi:hypothetical protein
MKLCAWNKVMVVLFLPDFSLLCCFCKEPSLGLVASFTATVCCLRPAWVCWVNLTKSVRGMRKETHTDTQTYNRKLGKGGLHVPDGKRERLPEPECLFYRSVQGKDSGKHQALTILWFKVKGMRFSGLIFLRLMKLNYSTSVLESSRHTGHLI